MSGISIRSLHKSFGKVEALRDINLEIDQGEFIALIGPSGCGKTTLLRTCLGLERPTKGTVLLGGQDAVAARKAKDLGIVFQKPALVPSRTSLSNVQITLDITGVKDHLDPHKLLEEFGLGSFKNHYPHQLSGGMQQRVNLAAAMVHNPHYLMMDEPFGALDEMTREMMCEWVGDVLLRQPKTVILVTHSIDEAVMLADRIVILAPRPGKIDTIVSVDLPRPRRRSLKTTTEFSNYVMDVRRQLYAVEEARGAA